MKSRRSTLVFLGVAAGIVIGFQSVPSLMDRFAGVPEFEPIDNLDGFRRISSGASSSGSFDPFLGLGDNDPRADAAIDAQVRANLCGSLHDDAKDDPKTVPIASFSDYYCPYCRVQMRRLAELAEEPGSNISVVWHELPLLGEASDLAAKAALAARMQGAYVDFNEALLSSGFRVNRNYLVHLSEQTGIDADQLLIDMESEEVARELAVSASLSRIFGFIGTPAMVVGRTVIQGNTSEQVLRRVIEIEREDDWRRGC